VVFSAPLNQVQGPVQTQFGYHLLEVTSRSE
jgi:peptidyl-prolyl cis-trans isomerase C